MKSLKLSQYALEYGLVCIVCKEEIGFGLFIFVFLWLREFHQINYLKYHGKMSGCNLLFQDH